MEFVSLTIDDVSKTLYQYIASKVKLEDLDSASNPSPTSSLQLALKHLVSLSSTNDISTILELVSYIIISNNLYEFLPTLLSQIDLISKSNYYLCVRVLVTLYNKVNNIELRYNIIISLFQIMCSKESMPIFLNKKTIAEVENWKLPPNKQRVFLFHLAKYFDKLGDNEYSQLIRLQFLKLCNNNDIDLNITSELVFDTILHLINNNNFYDDINASYNIETILNLPVLSKLNIDSFYIKLLSFLSESNKNDIAAFISLINEKTNIEKIKKYNIDISTYLLRVRLYKLNSLAKNNKVLEYKYVLPILGFDDNEQFENFISESLRLYNNSDCIKLKLDQVDEKIFITYNYTTSIIASPGKKNIIDDYKEISKKLEGFISGVDRVIEESIDIQQ